MRDLILKVASKDVLFRKLLITKLSSNRVKRKPGDVWLVKSGYRAMNEEGKAKSFKNQDKAKAYAKGKENKKEKSKKPQAAKVLGELKTLRPIFKDLSKKSPQKQKELAESLVTLMLDLKKSEGPERMSAYDELKKVREEAAKSESEVFWKKFVSGLQDSDQKVILPYPKKPEKPSKSYDPSVDRQYNKVYEKNMKKWKGDMTDRHQFYDSTFSDILKPREIDRGFH